MSNNEPPQNPTPDPQSASGTSGLPSYGSVEPPAGDTPPPPGGYPPPAPGGYGQPPAKNQKALVSMIVGIVSLVFSLCCTPIGFIGGIVAIVFGVLGRKDIAAGSTQQGSGQALAGIITGAVAILISVVSIILVLTGAIDYNFTTDFDS